MVKISKPPKTDMNVYPLQYQAGAECGTYPEVIPQKIRILKHFSGNKDEQGTARCKGP